jgi:hypothetical protein
MKITLKRKVDLKGAIVYLKIQTEVPREDIKNYLESGDFPNPVIERRVKKYLCYMGIYKETEKDNYQLTAKGNKAKETGKIEETEEGKYQIWYTQEDPLFGNRVFYFRRIKPDTRSDNPQLEKSLDIKLDEKQFVSLPIWGRDRDKKEPVNFSIINPINGYPGENGACATINCDWIWEDMKTSFFHFNGKLEWSEYDEKAKTDIVRSDTIDRESKVYLNIDFRPHIPVIIPNWNEETRRYRLRLGNIDVNDANDVYQYFEYSGQRNCEGFDYCYCDKLPVEPYNSEEARVWRNLLLTSELEKRYIHPDDFISNVIAINQKEGFAAYVDRLDIPDDIHQYIGAELERGKKSERGTSYWHLAAPLDLNVEIPQSLKLSVISFAKGEYISFQEFATKFNCGVDIEEVFYYDKYVITYYQQRSVAAFLKAFGIPKMFIVTDKNDQNFNDCLAKYDPQITVEDISAVFQNRKDSEHDRLLVFKSGGNLTVWTSTNSIDYIRFNCKGAIQPQENGHVEKSITYSRVRHEILGTQLKNYILSEVGK